MRRSAHLVVGAAGARFSSSSLDTLAGLRLDQPGLDWRPSHGRVLRAGDRVVLATTRRGLDFLMTGGAAAPSGAKALRGVTPHPRHIVGVPDTISVAAAHRLMAGPTS
ncbi:hypothetical protein [Streptomyces sp. NPDC002825]|uniref:hypothetical protein n=1 Tax=Streptomyces sp. NPDC002825 TaxID=3154666 RepID=UPI003333E7AB